MADGWIDTTLGEITTFASGYSFPIHMQGKVRGAFPFIKVSDMNTTGSERVVSSAANWVDSDDLAKMKARVWPPGTVIFPKVGAALMTEKRRMLGVEAGFDNNVMGLIPGPSLLPDYLYALMCVVRLGDLSQQGAVPSINQGHVTAIPVRLPPLDVQRRIADLIDALDTQIGAVDAERTETWSLLSALREHLLGPGRSVPLSEVCSIEGRLVDPRDARYGLLLHVGVEAIEKGTGRVLGARSAAADGLISAKYLYDDNDVIYAKIRPNLRKVAWPRGMGLCSADAYPLRPVTGLPASLLRETLLLDSVVEAVVGSSGRTKMPKVNRRELFAVDVPLGDPDLWPELDGPLAAVRATADALEQELDALRMTRLTLLAGLLSGEVEVPEAYDALLAEAG